jgi:hypothetical protein
MPCVANPIALAIPLYSSRFDSRQRESRAQNKGPFLIFRLHNIFISGLQSLTINQSHRNILETKSRPVAEEGQDNKEIASIMAAEIPTSDAPPTQDGIPAATIAERDIETPCALTTPKVAINGFENCEHISLKNKESGGSSEIEGNQIELPALKVGREDSVQFRVFGTEIPDSEATSDESPIESGGSHERVEMDTGEPSKIRGINEATIYTRGTSNKTITDVLALEKKEGEMEEAPQSSHFEESVETNEIALKEEDISSPGSLVAPSGDKQILNTAASSIEVDSLEFHHDVLRQVKDTFLAGFPRIAKERNVSVEDSSSSISWDSTNGLITAPIPSLNVFTIEPTAPCAYDEKFPKALSAEEAPSMFDTPVTGAEASQVSIRKGNVNVILEAVPLSLPSIDGNIETSLLEELDEASQEPIERTYKSRLSTEVPSSPAKRGESKSSQAKDTKATYTKGPEGSQNKNIMMAELKAMKIVGQIVFISLTYVFS